MREASSPEPEAEPLRVLLVEHSPVDAEAVRMALAKTPAPAFELDRVGSLGAALAHLAVRPVDVALISLSLPDADGLRPLAELTATHPSLPVIALCDEAHMGLELSLLRTGAQDIVNKAQIQLADLPRLLRVAIVRGRAQRARTSGPPEELEARVADGVVHEFGDLVLTILGNIELAQRSLPERSPARTSLDEIERAGESAFRLTRRLACYAGRSKLRPRRVALAQLLARPPELVGAPDLAGIAIRADLRHASRCVSADVTLMREVLAALLSNAAEACGEPPVRIRLRSGRLEPERHSLDEFRLESPLPAGRFVWFEVSDEGSGIEPTQLDRIFQPFHTTKLSRTGMGLAAAAGVVRRHGGSIGVVSEAGVGTRIRVWLPEASEEAQSPDRDDMPPARYSASGNEVATLLVVDGDPAARRTASVTLRRAGHRVVAASSRAEALARLTAPHDGPHISAAIVDLALARRHEGALLRALRAARPALPIVLCSEDENAALRSAQLVGERLAFATRPLKLAEVERSLRQAAGCLASGLPAA